MIERKPSAPFLLRTLTPTFKTHRKKFERIAQKNIFILSTGRAGTTFLAEYFNNLDNVYALHEPKPSRILRMWSMAYFDKKASPDFLRTALYNKRIKLYSDAKDKIYIESNPYLVGFPEVLDQVFENPIIIHIVRDPRDFVRSSMNHGNDTGIKLLFNKYVPYWYPNIEKDLGLSEELEMRFKAAGYWKIVNESLMSYGKNNPKNYHLLKFEDIFNGQQKGMDKLAKIVGVNRAELSSDKVSKEGVNKSRHSSVASWQDWSDDECRLINKLCEPVMSVLGYGQEKEWQSRIG
jgi:hypothetical protein